MTRTSALVLAATTAILPAFAQPPVAPAAAATPVAAAAQEDPIIAPGASLQKLSGEFKFTEGPTVDTKGDIYFTDQPNNRILKWSDGKLSTFITNAGRANGMYFDAKGNLIACCDEKTELWSIKPDGSHTVLVSQFDGKRFNGPNDVFVTKSGDMYITDPFFAREWWDYQSAPQDGQHVYYVTADGKTIKRVTTDLRQPNGICGTPDGKQLIVADMGGNKTWTYDIQPDGSLTNKTLRCSASSDGMTIDTQGNVYLSGNGGVTVYGPDGKRLTRIAVPGGWTANVCFGGKDRKTLFITSSTSFYSIQTKFGGVNPSK